jgi:prevent-host-death family protein
MPKMGTSEARENFTDLINRAAYGGERTVIRRRGKGMAAIVPIEDLKVLEELEDAFDRVAARKALAEVKKHGTIPWETVKARLGL